MFQIILQDQDIQVNMVCAFLRGGAFKVGPFFLRKIGQDAGKGN
jgi:hypothetical protein